MPSFVRTCCASTALVAAVAVSTPAIGSAGHLSGNQPNRIEYQSFSQELIALTGLETQLSSTGTAHTRAAATASSPMPYTVNVDQFPPIWVYTGNDRLGDGLTLLLGVPVWYLGSIVSFPLSVVVGFVTAINRSIDLLKATIAGQTVTEVWDLPKLSLAIYAAPASALLAFVASLFNPVASASNPIASVSSPVAAGVTVSARRSAAARAASAASTGIRSHPSAASKGRTATKTVAAAARPGKATAKAAAVNKRGAAR